MTCTCTITQVPDLTGEFGPGSIVEVIEVNYDCPDHGTYPYTGDAE